jgi:hypothetical protein
VNPEGGFGVGQLNVGAPEVLGAPGGEVRAPDVAAFAVAGPVLPLGADGPGEADPGSDAFPSFTRVVWRKYIFPAYALARRWKSTYLVGTTHAVGDRMYDNTRAYGRRDPETAGVGRPTAEVGLESLWGRPLAVQGSRS